MLGIVAPGWPRRHAAACAILPRRRTLRPSTPTRAADVLRQRPGMIFSILPTSPASTTTKPNWPANVPASRSKDRRKGEGAAVTRGREGSWIFADGQRHEIPCIKADEVVDPTGCGDAYRSSLLYGIAQGWNWRDAGQSGGRDGGDQDLTPLTARTMPLPGNLPGDNMHRAFGNRPW